MNAEMEISKTPWRSAGGQSRKDLVFPGVGQCFKVIMAIEPVQDLIFSLGIETRVIVDILSSL